LGPIPNPQTPIPNPQSPIPNPQYSFLLLKKVYNKKILIQIFYFNKSFIGFLFLQNKILV
jgi:hypothetical protein